MPIENVKLPVNVPRYLDVPDSASVWASRLQGGWLEDIPCPVSSEHMDKRRTWGNLVLQAKHNRRDEIIWSQYGNCAIHGRLAEELKLHGFSGYRLMPAAVRFPDGSESREYHEFMVTGWGGVARPESGVRVEETCPGCMWKRCSKLRDPAELIDEGAWTGDDFFVVWPFGEWFLSARAIEFFHVSTLRSCVIRELEAPRPPFDQGSYSASRLSALLPEDLAIRYGRPLGLEP
jgi:hypothetical protein